MSVRPIVRYPDPRLRHRAGPMGEIGDAARDCVVDLTDTLLALSAIGLAAQHIGLALRVMVIRLPGDPEPRPFLDPDILWMSAERARHTEGSVSMPGVTDAVERPERVRMRFRDVAGTVHEEDAEGFRAACWQHEIDQLDGIFWIDRLSRLRRERLLKRYGKAFRPS
ncbi:MAG: peptide deformylase [Microvirga sp.]